MGDESRMQKGTPSIVVSIILDDGEEVRVELGGSPIIIGSSESCDIVISSSFVSRKHAMLYVKDGGVYIEDINSSNGTQVEGVPISRHLLSGGESISLGEWKATFLLGFNDALDSLSPFSVGEFSDDEADRNFVSDTHKPSVSPVDETPIGFDWFRLKPLLVYCLLFGWIFALFGNNRYIIDNPWIPVSIFAVISIPLAAVTIVYFLRPHRLHVDYVAGVTLFTMVVGIVALIILQSVAQHVSNMQIRNYGKSQGVFFLLKLVGWSYQNVESGSLIKQFAGSVFGVGLCEETIKLLPLFYLIFRDKHGDKLGFRGFLLIGFFSGLGFGISEALLQYAPWSVDPVLTLSGNITRWFACVPMHAVYTVIDAAFLWWLAPSIIYATKFNERLLYCILATLAVAVLHGTYNTVSGLFVPSIILDGLSIGLMYFAVKVVAQKSDAREVVVPCSHSKGIVKWVAGFRPGGREFYPYFIFLAFLIFGASFFTISEEEFEVSLRYYQYWSDAGQSTGKSPSLTFISKT